MKKNFFILFILSTTCFAGQNEKMIGFGTGASFLSKSQDGIDKKGLNLEIKGIYSIDQDFFNYDLGLGYQRNQIKGDLNPGEIKISTNSLFLEADAKYKFSKNYFGPSLKMLSGTDTTFKENELDNSNNFLAGLKYQYDFQKENSINYRIEASIYSSLIDPKILTYQLGINFGFKDQKVIQRAEPPLRLEEASDIKITIKSARVKFDSGEFVIDSYLKEKLVNLGRYLLENNVKWGKIKISGHTDNQGNYDYNKDLAKKRAEEIKSIFVSVGVDSEKIETISYSFSVPIADNSTVEGRSKNRRVEVEFFNVKNREELNKNIVKILE